MTATVAVGLTSVNEMAKKACAVRKKYMLREEYVV